MNKAATLLFFVTLLAFSACKTKQKIITPSGEVEVLAPKKAEKAIDELPAPPAWVELRANVEVVENGSKQRASAIIRIKQDSILWVELMDPVIGLKAARAFAQQDTVAFLNRIERNYFAGSYEYVEKKLGTSLPFPYIFKLFMGQLLVSNGTVQLAENQYFYTATDADGNQLSAQINPVNFQCSTQALLTATDRLNAFYTQYKTVNGYQFPQKIVVNISGRKNIEALIEIKEINTAGPFKTPFKINSKYERID